METQMGFIASVLYKHGPNFEIINTVTCSKKLKSGQNVNECLSDLLKEIMEGIPAVVEGKFKIISHSHSFLSQSTLIRQYSEPLSN
jgi:hypothetical protein